MIKIKLDLKKIPEDKIFAGQKGDYVDLILFDNRDGVDSYGNAGFVALDVTKEEREAGEKGAIVGNFRHIGGTPKTQQQPPQQRPPRAQGLPQRPQTQSQGRRPSAPPPRPPVDPDLDSGEPDDVPFNYEAHEPR